MVPLDDDGRALLVDRVWGRLDHRDRVNRPAAAMMLVGGLTMGFSLLAFNGLGLVFGFGSLVSGGLVRLVRVGRVEEDRRERRRALPAGRGAQVTPVPRVFGGDVVADEVCQAPMSYRYCVAYAIELRDEWARDTFLRDAVTIGFTVRGNDEREVVIPPGPILLSGGTSRQILLEEQIRAYLGHCDPAWHPDRYDPFPYATALEAILCEGDRIEVHNELEPLREKVAETDYRHAAIARLRPVGVPRIHLLSRGR